MTFTQEIKKQKNMWTILLAVLGIGIIVFYALCDTSCVYLEGDILGLDMKYIGTGYMLAIILFAAFRKNDYVRALLASGIGVEVYLIFFQFREEVFCPFCLAFAATLIAAFILNYDTPLSKPNDSKTRRFVYALGEAEIPIPGKLRIPLLFFVIAGYVFVALTFSGSTTPAYGADKSSAPSYGSGRYEIIIFTDYFCPPCQQLESHIDPALEEFLARGGVKVTFVDLPVHKETHLYARYFLYAAHAGRGYRNALHARRVLFSLAASRAASDEDNLRHALNARGVAFTPYDLKPVYHTLNRIIRTYKVKSTPTCIIRYSSTDIRRYSGTFEIQNGLAMLRATLKNTGR
ncbi:MAG: hypothetical protein FJ139_05515 [Deltaproteobacteria bacterium]|nr:hypothetical protein [Deltaproteobacteria bacterium]